MRIAYLECFAGIAGDMLLGALIDAGVPQQVLVEATTALGLGASLQIERVDRSGITCTKVHVLVDGHLAEATSGSSPAREPDEQQPLKSAAHTHQPGIQPLRETEHTHSHDPKHTHSHDLEHPHTADEQHAHSHGEHPHDGHAHNHDEHAHSHGRSLTAIRGLIEAAALDAAVKQTAFCAFELLGRSEAKIHNVPVDEIHFHEVGAVDAIVDIVAASAGIHHLSAGAWYSSAVNVGGGTVECAHGTFPVPAPATADLLRGLPTYSAHVLRELTTPTGAALLRALNPSFGAQPAMRVEGIGYGAGTRNFKDFPNVLRLSVGEACDVAAAQPTGDRDAAKTAGDGSASQSDDLDRETVCVLETALDDLSPQVLAHVAERALALGALDAMLTPVLMKKGRPGTLLTVLCKPAASATLERLILAETSTLGVRIRQERRLRLARSHVRVSTAYGEIRVKVGSLGGQTMNAAPEFEDCRGAAERHGVAVKQVQQAAVAAYLRPGTDRTKGA